MSLQIKIFSSAHVNLDGLENQVNNWLAEHSNCQVQDIKVAFSENHIIMTLLYQLEKSAMKSPPQVQRNQVEIQRQVPK